MLNNEGNSAKSTHGADLNRKVHTLLKELKRRGLIKNFRKEPRYNYPGHALEQFSPDFEIELTNGEIIIIDNTTTARHDRFKQKQWDAHGVKSHFAAKGIKVKYYILLPDDHEIGNEKSREKEIKAYHAEKRKVNNPDYYSAVDDLIQISDLIQLIQSQ